MSHQPIHKSDEPNVLLVPISLDPTRPLAGQLNEIMLSPWRNACIELGNCLWKPIPLFYPFTDRLAQPFETIAVSSDVPAELNSFYMWSQYQQRDNYYEAWVMCQIAGHEMMLPGTSKSGWRSDTLISQIRCWIHASLIGQKSVIKMNDWIELIYEGATYTMPILKVECEVLANDPREQAASAQSVFRLWLVIVPDENLSKVAPKISDQIIADLATHSRALELGCKRTLGI